ncbi:hypothetical protein C2G38_2179153 [Gigaspora rosea]|uniref:Uncharacterized protein n=1 Tax=Gigaspora rosea TaxID=44941 RepID=A0A397VHL8_9GLOM|nr:hypothetical protein C2G38_2179153 [Gigaspora rosea]
MIRALERKDREIKYDLKHKQTQSHSVLAKLYNNNQAYKRLQKSANESYEKLKINNINQSLEINETIEDEISKLQLGSTILVDTQEYL